jgi:DNA polymerase III subunit delta'
MATDEGSFGATWVVASKCFITSEGQLPLPWLAQPLQRAIAAQKGHALLVHGPQGIGQFEFALSLAQTWLCTRVQGGWACGQCPSCQLVHSQSHPDLLVLVPEALAATHWGEESVSTSAKTKPSKDIKIEAARLAVQFAQTTPSQSAIKVVLIHPAERMNTTAAHAILKTLEEPTGVTRFILSCGAPQALLPTIRSRCQALALPLPTRELALAWLSSQHVAQPQVMLDGAGGQPVQAWLWVQEGIDAKAWLQIPQWVFKAQADMFIKWPPPRLVEALQKLCHDALCVAHGAAPRYFPLSSLPMASFDAPRLHAWSQELARTQAHVEHPWHQTLMVQSLVLQAHRAIVPVAKPRKMGTLSP